MADETLTRSPSDHVEFALPSPVRGREAMTRFFLYSHDTYGLGHLRRSTLLAEAIVRADPCHDVLIATGSPQAQAFSLPERVDSLKLPSATKDGAGAYQPRKLGGSIRELIRLRSALVMAAVETYAPEVILVDHAPLGMSGELVAVLDRYAGRAGGPRLVLGLRDIIDDADQVDKDWQQSGTWGWLDCYDDILVYGDPRIRTTASELDLESRVTGTVTYAGYVAPAMPEPMIDVEPYLLVTPGGGGDGQIMLRRYLDAVDAGATSGMRSLVVTGPLMSTTRREELFRRARRSPSVDLIEFSDQMRTLIASASGVVSMAGYNTVVEELGRRGPRHVGATMSPPPRTTHPGRAPCAALPLAALPDRASRHRHHRPVRSSCVAAPSGTTPWHRSRPRRRRDRSGGSRTAPPTSPCSRIRTRTCSRPNRSPAMRCPSSPLASTVRQADQLHVGYILKQYPRLSETFILNEILGVEGTGAKVSVFSLRPPTEGRFHSDLASVKADVHYVPAPEKQQHFSRRSAHFRSFEQIDSARFSGSWTASPANAGPVSSSTRSPSPDRPAATVSTTSTRTS